MISEFLKNCRNVLYNKEVNFVFNNKVKIIHIELEENGLYRIIYLENEKSKLHFITKKQLTKIYENNNE
jgi:hypothetical protein